MVINLNEIGYFYFMSIKKNIYCCILKHSTFYYYFLQFYRTHVQFSIQTNLKFLYHDYYMSVWINISFY